jgi:hypothetical protein
MPDELKPYDPTIREMLAEKLQSSFESMGADRYKARKRAQTLIGGPNSNLPLNFGAADIAASVNPIAATAMLPIYTQEAIRGLERAGEAGERGDIIGAGVEGTFGLLGLVPAAAGLSRAVRRAKRFSAEKDDMKSREQRYAEGGDVEALRNRVKALLGGELKPEQNFSKGGSAKEPVKAAIKTGVEKARELFGALRPAKEPVRGQTGAELRQAQMETLTPEQLDKLEQLKKQYPRFGEASTFMTPQEVSKIIQSGDGVAEVDRLLQILPQTHQVSSVAKAGEPKRGWYRASTQALIDVFGDDAPRFASLLASLSPQTSVEMNLLNTLNVWKNWTGAGRPTDPTRIKEIMGRSVAGSKGEQSVLDAWVNNAVRSLSAADPTKVTLSGPKVDSFYRNLADDVYKVTNDAWMASGLGVRQDLFSGSPTAIQIARGDPGLTPGYMATSARMREAGQMANILPSEAQETTWSVFMPLYEMQARTGLPAREILQRGLLTPEAVRGTPDFSTLLRDPKYAGILEQGGYGGQLERLRPHQWGTPRMDLSMGEQRELERVAERLEGLKGSREMESRAKTFVMPKQRPTSAFAYATPEYIPGAKTGHLEDLIEAPIGSRQNFSSRAAGAFKDIQGRDVLHSSLGLPSLETRSMTGAYRPEGQIPFAGGYLGGPSTTGRLAMETQPGFAAGVEVPLTKGLTVPARQSQALTAAEAVRGALTAQRGSPWNVQIPSSRGTSAFFPLEKKAGAEEMGLSAALQGPESALADTGRGVALLNWGQRPSKQDLNVLGSRLGSSKPVRTKNISDYVDYSQEWEKAPGSGAVTRKMLEQVNKLPEAQRAALSKAAQDPAGELLKLYEQTAKTKGGTTREDLMTLLRIVRDKGLPGAAAALVAGEALPAEQTKRTGGLAVLRRSAGRGRVRP